MAISFRNAASKNQAAAGTIVVNKPASVASGDVMYAVLESQTTNHSTLAGWTEVAYVTDTGTDSVTVLRRVADGSEGATFTFSNAGNGLFNGAVSAYIGVDNTTPEDATPTTGHGGTTAAVAPSITTITDNAWFVAAFATVNVATTLSLPAGFTNDVALFGSGGDEMRVDHKLIAAHGATGTATSTSDDNAAEPNWLTVSLALRPAATGGGAFVPALSQPQIWAQIMVAGTRTRVGAHSGGSTYARQITTWFRAQPRRPITAGSAAQNFFQTLSVTTTTTVSVLKQVGKLLSVTSTTGVALIKQVGKLLAVTMTATVALVTTKLKLVVLAVTMTAVASISRQIGKLVAVTSTTTPAIIRQVQKRLSVTATTAPALLKSITKILSVSAVTAPFLNAIKAVVAPALAVIAILISRDGRAALRARSGISPLGARAGGAILRARNMIAKLLARSGRL